MPTCPSLYLDAFRTTQKLKYFKAEYYSWNCDMLYSFLCFLYWYIKKGGHCAYFQAIVPQSATYFCRKQGSIEKSCHFVCVCTLITLCVHLSRVKFYAVRMRNAISWNPLNQSSWVNIVWSPIPSNNLNRSRLQNQHGVNVYYQQTVITKTK